MTLESIHMLIRRPTTQPTASGARQSTLQKQGRLGAVLFGSDGKQVSNQRYSFGHRSFGHHSSSNRLPSFPKLPVFSVLPAPKFGRPEYLGSDSRKPVNVEGNLDEERRR